MTIVEAMTAATAALNNAVAKVLGFYDIIAAQLDAKAAVVTTTINQFLGRPPVQIYFVDPVGGNDAADGLTIASPKKDLYSLVDNLGTTASTIVLLGDYLWRKRTTSYATLTIRGAQYANTAQGWIDAQRTFTYLATAENSPLPNTGSFCAGLWMSGPNFTTLYINHVLPLQPSGAAAQTYPDHFHSDSGTSVTFRTGTLLVGGAASGNLFGVFYSKSTVFSDLTFGAGATGHLLLGISAGANPNNYFAYASNLNSV